MSAELWNGKDIVRGEKVSNEFQSHYGTEKGEKNPSRVRFELRKIFLFLKGWG